MSLCWELPSPTCAQWIRVWQCTIDGFHLFPASVPHLVFAGFSSHINYLHLDPLLSLLLVDTTHVENQTDPPQVLC